MLWWTEGRQWRREEFVMSLLIMVPRLVFVSRDGFPLHLSCRDDRQNINSTFSGLGGTDDTCDPVLGPLPDRDPWRSVVGGVWTMGVPWYEEIRLPTFFPPCRHSHDLTHSLLGLPWIQGTDWKRHWNEFGRGERPRVVRVDTLLLERKLFTKCLTLNTR